MVQTHPSFPTRFCMHKCDKNPSRVVRTPLALLLRAKDKPRLFSWRRRTIVAQSAYRIFPQHLFPGGKIDELFLHPTNIPRVERQDERTPSWRPRRKNIRTPFPVAPQTYIVLARRPLLIIAARARLPSHRSAAQSPNRKKPPWRAVRFFSPFPALSDRPSNRSRTDRRSLSSKKE